VGARGHARRPALLTFITVAVTREAWLDFGATINLWIALLNATVKATLVAQ
jgi:hypothetical protein